MSNPIRSDPIRSDTVRSDIDFVDVALFTSLKVILGYFRSFQKSLKVILGFFRSFQVIPCFNNYQWTLPQFLLWFATHFTFLHSKLQSYTPWNHFLQEYIYIYIFYIWSCTRSNWQGFERLSKDYKLKVQLAYLIDFAQFLLQFALNFTFWHSIWSNTTLESLFS